MKELLSRLDVADFRFLAGIIESPVNFTDDARLRSLCDSYEAGAKPETRAEIEALLEKEIRYLGSAEAFYVLRSLTGQEAGVPFSEIVRDVAGQLKVPYTGLGTESEQVARIAEEFATRQFAGLKPEEQQRLLEELGVEREKAAAFLKRSAGVFALPLLVETFNAVIVQGLIKTVIFGTIARILGKQLAGRLFAFLAARLPWWVTWVGPGIWALSIGWTALDLQGPATRKTVPIVLYLGLCVLRERAAAAA